EGRHSTKRRAPIASLYPSTTLFRSITAATDKTLVERAMRYGVQNYLIKPITIDRFTNTIEKYLKNKNLLKNKEEVNQDVVDKLLDRKSTRLNSSHVSISYAVFCLKK